MPCVPALLTDLKEANKTSRLLDVNMFQSCTQWLTHKKSEMNTCRSTVESTVIIKTIVRISVKNTVC